MQDSHFPTVRGDIKCQTEVNVDGARTMPADAKSILGIVCLAGDISIANGLIDIAIVDAQTADLGKGNTFYFPFAVPAAGLGLNANATPSSTTYTLIYY